MNESQAQKLETLAAFIEKIEETGEKPGRNTFYFSEIRVNHKNSCGAAACAIGWMPEALPDDAKLVNSDRDLPNVMSLATGEYGFSAAEDIFGIDDEESSLLFAPNGQDGYWQERGFRLLGHDATGAQVASNIRKFIAFKRSQGEVLP